AYFLTGAAGSRLADELLCRGRRVTLVGASDCHLVVEIGTAWTGIYAQRRTAKALIEALRAGNCFASEAPLLDVSVNGKPMGSTLKPKAGAKLKLRARIAAAAGVAFVKVISDGKVIKEVWPKHEPRVNVTVERKAKRKAGYFRIETADANGRRAFSTPIYIRP
ncbi:MAG: CehA/McbA family metallohydrolase, partial [Planctomycetota bacterium]